MAGSKEQLQLHLVGMVRLSLPDGTDVTPRGARARGLLAILALSRDMVRGRRWVEGKLWSTRDPRQAGASLRQTLTELRRAMGQLSDALTSDRTAVGLNPDAFWVDLLQDPAFAARELAAGAELMDGLDVSDDAFLAWRDDQRARFRGEVVALGRDAPQPDALPTAPVPLAEDGPPKLLIAADHSGSRTEDAIADAIGRQIGRSAKDKMQIDLAVPGPQTQLHSRRTLKFSPQVVDEGGSSFVSLELVRPSDGALLWSDAVSLDATGPNILTENELVATANRAAEEIAKHASALSEGGPDSDAAKSAALLQTGITEMFTMDGARMQLADQFFRAIEDERDAAVASAWRSLLAMIMFAEQIDGDPKTARERVMHHLARALEANCQHPTILGVASQIISFMNLPGYNALELAQEAVRINRWNPMARLALGMAHLRKGRVQEGYKIVAQSRAYASRLHNRHWWDMSFCLAALSAGKIDEAIEAAEASLTFHPDFRPPMRHLYVLYLHKGRIADAEQMLRRMRKLEPEFSLRQMREDPTYPVVTIRRTPLISLPDMPA